MKTTLLSAVCGIAFAVSAFANPVMVNGSGSPAQAQVYGDGSAASASRSTATSSSGSSASVKGVKGGNASSSVTVNVAPSGGKATAHHGSPSHTPVYQAAAQPPSIMVPGGSGFDCPTVGFGASGAGLTGGGGFGPSWISSRCDHRKYAMDVILPLMGRDAALAYLASVESDVDDFTKKWARDHQPIGVLSTYTPVRGATRFDYGGQ